MACSILFATPLPLPAKDGSLGLRVPPGFEVTEFADSKLANDIFSMTLDPRGRVVVSGAGYIRILVDDDNQGRADRAIEFAPGPKDGAQGLLWEGWSLYFTGDGGLGRYRVKEGRADGPSELIRAMKTGGEHNAHAIRRGPDGWLYVLCGNSTGIDKSYAQLATSPIKDPVAGCVLRFRPDLQSAEIVADGFRNAYDMDFNSDGELFTFDSDNERCVSLPWYESTRFYHVIPGGHYGWQAPQRAETWRCPPYFCDLVAPVAYFGRGSPTGVACYRHVQFPEKYRGGFFLLDWTFGRVYFVSLQRSGSTYTCRKELFLEAVGDNGFAPTAVTVHPRTGDLFIAIGGRGTRGAVYRVRYTKAGSPTPEASTALAPLQIKPRCLDWRPGSERPLLDAASAKQAPDRLQALLGILRHRRHFQPAQIQQAIQANWAYPDRYVRQIAASLIASLNPQQQQALAKQARTPSEQTTYCLGTHACEPAEVIARASRILRDEDAGVESRLASVRLLQLALGDLMSPKSRGTVWEGYSPRRDPVTCTSSQPASSSPAQAAAFLAAPLVPILCLGAQPAMLGVACCQQAARPGPDRETLCTMVQVLRTAFPTGDADLDREMSRTLAMVEDDAPGTLAAVAARLTAASHPVEDVHYLIVLARLRAPRTPGLTERVAAALLALDKKLAERHLNRDRNWPLRIAELHAELARKDAKLNGAMLASGEFGRPDHALFARPPGFDRRRAAEVFLARAQHDEDYPWNADLVTLMGDLPAERALPVLRDLWGKAGLEESILPLLARHPEPADRDKFLQGLDSPQLPTVRGCVAALEKLPGGSGGAQVLALVRCLRRLGEAGEEKTMRQELAKYLARLTGEKKFGADAKAWTDWFVRNYPDFAVRLANIDGVDLAAWSKRLDKLDWPAGDAERGRGIFIKASCATCHSGGHALGPDLRGAAGRFSRDDLLTAILQPSRDIAPRYRTALITTTNGKIYQGLVIYEAVDGLILQTGPAETVRIPGQQIASRRFTATSLMPAGLLDKLSDREIADLYAYLKSLGHSQASTPERTKPERGR